MKLKILYKVKYINNSNNHSRTLHIEYKLEVINISETNK